GELPEFQPKKVITNKEYQKAFRMMARTVQMGLVSSTVAFRDAGLEVGKIDPARAGVEFGAGMVASELDDLGRASRVSLTGPDGPVGLGIWGETGLKEVPPLWMLKYLPNMPACHASITLDLQGPSNTHTQSDAASLLALGEAFRILQRDVADVMVVGGTESKMNPLSQTRHNLFQQLSKRTDDPTRAMPDVFGPKTPVWALKGNMGSSGAAAGAVELIGSVLALHRGELPPTLNCEHPDPECPIHVHADGVRPVARPYAVKLNFTDK